MNLETIGVKSVYCNQSLIHSGYDSAGSIADLDLEDEQLRKTNNRDDQSKSNAIKNHSVVKTSRVAETRATHPPQVMSPMSLRRSQGSPGLQIHIKYVMRRKNLENKITKLRSPKK